MRTKKLIECQKCFKIGGHFIECADYVPELNFKKDGYVHCKKCGTERNSNIIDECTVCKFMSVSMCANCHQNISIKRQGKKNYCNDCKKKIYQKAYKDNKNKIASKIA